MKGEYYKITKDHRTYKGERYFRVTDMDISTQVCVFAGDVKKGKNNAVGIILIHTLTLYANYVSPGYAIRCTKAQFDKAFKRVITLLK